MSVLFTGASPGDLLDATPYSANFNLLENSLLDLGPWVATGLVPSIGTGLSVNVTSGTASIGGRVTASGSFVIGGLSPSTLNHLYILQSGAGASNTTGTPPALSTKLGTATTGASTVTSVNVLRSSGRQTLVRHELQVPGAVGSMGSVDLTSWAAAAADGVQVAGVLPAGAVPSTLTAPLTLTADDASQSAVTRVAIFRHTYNAGNGANGIGAGIQFEAENTAGGNNVLGRLDFPTTNAVSANFTTNAEIHVANNNADVLGLKIDNTGALTLLDGGNLILGSTNGTKFGTATTQKLGFYNATPVVQPANTVDVITGLVNQGLRAGGGNPDLNLNAGTLTAGTASLSLGVRGNGGAISLGTATVAPGVDADYTLTNAEMANGHIILNTGSLTVGRNIIMPATTGGFYTVFNNTAFIQTFKTAAGTGVAVGAGKTALLRTGANVLRLTADV